MVLPKNRISMKEEGFRVASDYISGSPTMSPALRLLTTVGLRLDPRLSDFLRLGQIRLALLASAPSDGHPPV